MKAAMTIAGCLMGLVLPLALSCDQHRTVVPPAIPFAPTSNPSLKDPDNPTREELSAIRKAVAAYQAVFNTH